MPEKRVITAEDLYRFQLISDCEISPDGEYVVFSVQRVDQKTEKKYANLWVIPTDGGHGRQFTYGDQRDTRPRWSPDGRQIAFLSNRKDEKQPQLHLIPFDGGEARPLTDLKGEFISFAWSPDGRQFACAFRKKDQAEIEREEDEEKKKLGIVARHISRVHYKLDGTGFLPQGRIHIWTIDAQTGEAKQLTASQIHDESEPCWSPDGKEIVFCSNRSDDPDFNPEAIDLFAVPTTGVEPGDETTWRKIETPFGQKSTPVFSPDGRWIAYYGREGHGDWWKHTHLWVIPADGQGAARDLTAAYDLQIGNASLNDLGGLVTAPPAWSADSRILYFQVSHHGDTLVKAISVAETDDDAPPLEPVIETAGVVGAFSLDKAAGRLAYFQAAVTSPGQIWVRDLPAGEARQVTHFNEDWLAEVELGQVEAVWFKGAAGNMLQGWLLKPPDFDPGQTYPAIIEMHGGPLGQYANAFMHEFYYLAANGYVVAYSNPRGGYGYGEDHARAIWNNHGTADYEDVMAWADVVAAQPYVDSERMGVTGGSYGGFLTNWIIGHTDRFKAAVSQRSIMNRLSSYGSSDVNWRRQIAFDDQPPWENLENYWRQSPLKYIGNAKTPTLVIHSEQDLRCPLEQGEQLFVALKVLGVETEMVRFPDEPHGLSRTGRTDRRIVRLGHILRWFERYLK